MSTTVLSSKGRVIIPQALREALRWGPGTQLEALTPLPLRGDEAGLGFPAAPHTAQRRDGERFVTFDRLLARRAPKAGVPAVVLLQGEGAASGSAGSRRARDGTAAPARLVARRAVAAANSPSPARTSVPGSGTPGTWVADQVPRPVDRVPELRVPN